MKPATPPAPKLTWTQLLQQINYLLSPVKEIVVFIGPNPDLDALVAGVGLTEALKGIGRKANVVSPTKISGELGELPIAETVLDFIPEKQLETTITYKTGSLANISFQKEPDSLKLKLIPESGGQPIEPAKVNYKQHEFKPKAAFTIAIENLAHLQEFYQQNEQFFKQIPIINIDYHKTNAKYGRINLIDTKARSVSEMITLMLYDLRVRLSPEVAKMLYQGIGFKTNNFSPESFSANSLEATSICLRYQQPIKLRATTIPTPRPTASTPTRPTSGQIIPSRGQS
jgi:nanoRNase/pAp phosphatase (c-di-AMP/oligoRNAs hydrolase)